VFGLITGSGFYDIPDLVGRSTSDVETPYGPVRLTTGRWRGRAIGFLPRHGPDHSIPPHAINYRANIWALRHVGADAIVATAVSGGIDPAMVPGSLVVISDFLELTSGRSSTFFDGIVDPGFGAGSVGHTDMTTAYDPGLRALLLRVAVEESIEVIDGGVYCTTNGPRFETPAEIAMMGRLGGDLVGMTGYPEVALAREAGVPYAAIGVISNAAAGVAEGELSSADIMTVVERTAGPLYRLIGRTIELFDAGSLP
jgi:5'-deoxy-5'-methylthioadenosine phosphorylase